MLKTQRAFSLVELVVGMAIFGILLALAAPSYSAWIRNAKIRTAAESLQYGLQLAKAEAVKRNTAVRLQLTDTTEDGCTVNVNGPNWYVSLDDVSNECEKAASDTVAPRIIQFRNAAEGGGDTIILTAGQASFVFNGMGRLTSTAAAIDVSNGVASFACIVDGGNVRCLRVAVSSGGQIRMCDPSLPSTDAQAC